MEDDEFIDSVLKDFKDLNSDFNDKIMLGDLFPLWFLEYILFPNHDTTDLLAYLIGGSRDDRIDIGIADEDNELVIVGQCKFPNGNALISKDNLRIQPGTYNKDLIDEILSGISRINSSPNTGNQKRREFVSSFNEFVNKDKSNLKTMAIGFGKFDADAIKYAIKKDVDIYDFERIKREYIRNTSPERALRPPEILKFTIKEGKIGFSSQDYKTSSFFVKIDKIGEAVEKSGDSLFIDNLRYKLEGAAHNKIANEIERTIRNRPDALPILNNGITIVCSGIELNNIELIIKDPKIVNGCQTCWAIYSAYQKDKNLGAYVYVKIIETRDQKYIKEITQAANNQNPITPRDTHASDDIQKDIFKAFSDFKPKILYDYKAGLIKALDRKNQLSAFNLPHQGRGRPKQRIIDNVLSGQLYLALLGNPISAKTRKKEIFEKLSIYETIFSYNLPREQRFKNEDLGIIPADINLLTGKVDYFVKDIFFAFSILKLTRAFSDLYKRKLGLFSQSEMTSNTVYSMLENDFSFIKYWDLLVVAAINVIIDKWGDILEDNFSKEERITKLRETLLNKQDPNNLWNPHLSKQFNFEGSKVIADLVKSKAPSPTYPVFGKWISSISNLLYNLVKKEEDELGVAFNMRKFIQLSEETYSKLRKEIESKMGLNQERDIYFPVKLKK